VAAAVDYVPVSTPSHGSLARHVHSQVLKKRRQALSLEPTEPFMLLPGALTPPEKDAAELEGGSIIVGRHTLKEFIEGLRRGWTGGVDEWDWDKEVKDKLEFDGVFATKPEVSDQAPEAAVVEPPVAPSAAPQQVGALGSLSFLSRPAPNVSINPSTPASVPATIPSHMHIPPNPLPAQPPLLYVPFTNHLGFKQIPYMIYDFFTERNNVRAGGEAAMALILGSTRPFSPSSGDLDLGIEEEAFYKKDFADLPKRTEDSRKQYYDALGPKIIAARQLASGERQLTDEEVKSGKSGMNEWELKDERLKKESRWMGNLMGWDIVKKGEPVHWTDAFDGWLKIFEKPQEQEPLLRD
jgi:import inner membrane translocase subunit TIM54